MLFGAAMDRAVTLAVNWRLAPREMEYILDHAQARVLFVGEEFLGHVAQMKLPHVAARGGVRDAPPAAGQVSYAEWQRGAPADRSDARAAIPTRPATSSTPRAPRGCRRASSSPTATSSRAMDVGAKAWSFDTASVNLVAMPLFHIAGSGWGVAGFCDGAHQHPACARWCRPRSCG